MIKKVYHNLGEYRKYAIITPILKLIETVLEVFIPFLMKDIIDVGIPDGNIPYIVQRGLIMIGLAITALVLGATAGRTSALAGAGLSRNLRKNMYYNLQSLSFSNIDKYQTSSIVTRLTTDIANVQNATQMILRLFVRAPVMIIASILLAFSINAKLSLVFIGVIPFLAFFLFFLMSRAHPNFILMFKKYDTLNSVVQENLIGIRAVKSYVREDNEVEKFNASTSELMGYGKKAEKILAFLNPLMMTSMYVCILAISWFGGKMVIDGVMKVGDMSVFLTYIAQILSSLMMITMVFVMITISRSSAQRISELLDERSDIVSVPNAQMSVNSGSVDFDNVTFAYTKDGEDILCDINISIKPGETVGIVGGTGSAKSSLVQLIPRLYDVRSGAVKVGGQDVREIDLKTLRESVAMVLQQNVLFSGTIEENLRWGNSAATDEEVQEAARTAQAHEFIMGFPNGYKTYLEQGGVNLSGGQKQRLCIARALIKRPKILILDDSTSAVDTKTDANIREALKKFHPDITKIIIAQRVASVEGADKIIVMHDGQVIAAGTHAELMQSSDIYKEIYQLQTMSVS